ncbi:GroES-like protein [Tilletiaria anomala UBC 951]|uniref:GroES-like protein n=1 Tax=Tilletiaria anomala (strain ATCC 24038 / CBS 436.72 / UBC 951) TaxID=1037660 RepID=A0A066WR96_TILAU|nr:GroES-like protein [Tilletiaria anomala UBC 951]KDN53170.1 GroES-like protein [Tilletiaria anomala UBC 951]
MQHGGQAHNGDPQSRKHPQPYRKHSDQANGIGGTGTGATSYATVPTEYSAYPTFKSGVRSLIEEKTMAAVTWQGKGAVALREVDVPHVTNAEDIVIRTTGTSLCHADMHIYRGDVFDLKLGDIMGHEAVGQVVQLGSAVKNLQLGDRVCCSFALGCGSCEGCQRGETGRICDKAGHNGYLGKLYGERHSSLEGHAHFSSGGIAGCQAQYVRIPCAENNVLRVPNGVSDETALFLSDVAVSAYHAVRDVGLQSGNTVLIIGSGPVGQLVAQWVQVFGARRIVLVDSIQSRLDWAKQKLGPAIEATNSDSKTDCPHGFSQKMHELEPHGFDICFELAELAIPRRLGIGSLQKAMKTLSAGHGITHPLNECILAARNGGRVSIIADYAGQLGNFNMGLLTEKGVKLYGHGQPPVQRYWQEILEEYIMPGRFDPTKVLTHRYALEELPKLYDAMYNRKLFEESKDKPILKVFVQTKFSAEPSAGMPPVTKAHASNGAPHA